MYIDIETVVTVGKLLGALGTIGGLFLGVYKFVEAEKKQGKEIKAIKAEQTVICYGVLACLKGLKEQGCDGPVSDALDKLEKYLNKAAHDEEGTAA